MRGKNVGRRYDLKCRIKIELFLQDIETDALEPQESGMPLVHVKHIRLDTECGECFHSANPEHDLLTHPHFEIATVKLGSNQSVLGAVLGNIGIEQVDVYPSDAQFPKPGKNFSVQDRHCNAKVRITPTYLADW